VAGNITGFMGLPGVGKKTAERSFLELREKLAKRTLTGARPGGRPRRTYHVVVRPWSISAYRPRPRTPSGNFEERGTDLGEVLKGALKALSNGKVIDGRSH